LRNRGLETVLFDLSEVGYDAEWHCLPASAIGAPHRRDRIYIMAYSNSGGLERTVAKGWNCGNVVGESCVGRKEEIGGTSENVADSNGERMERNGSMGLQRKESLRKYNKSSFTSDVSFAYNFNYWLERKKGFFEKNRRETWSTDAGVLRVANGIPNRIQRIKCLGNAVVPQVAEFFAEMIKEKLEAKKGAGK
jgi:DNA (cytosine-5)-methyltransferase 1